MVALKGKLRDHQGDSNSSSRDHECLNRDNHDNPLKSCFGIINVNLSQRISRVRGIRLQGTLNI